MHFRRKNIVFGITLGCFVFILPIVSLAQEVVTTVSGPAPFSSQISVLPEVSELKTTVTDEMPTPLPVTSLTQSVLPVGINGDVQQVAVQSSGAEMSKEDDMIDKQQYQDSRDFSNIIKQTTEYTCGPAALATLINLMGGKTEEMEIAKLSGTTEDRGTTMLGLKNAAKESGYNGTGKKMKFYKITKESLPLIVKIVVENEETKELKDHFIVLKKIEDDRFFVADPVDGNVILNEKEFENVYQGSVFSISMTQNSEILDPITGEIVKLKNLSQESALALIEEMSDDEMSLESGKFAALLKLLPSAIRSVIASTSFKVTASFVSDLVKHPDRLKAYSKIGIVAKKVSHIMM